MKKLLIILLCLGLVGCGFSSSSYDKGVEDGFDGAKKSILYNFDKNYRNGYENGLDDAYYYDLGYSDAQDDKSPRYPDDSDYMDGYRDGQ